MDFASSYDIYHSMFNPLGSCPEVWQAITEKVEEYQRNERKLRHNPENTRSGTPTKFSPAEFPSVLLKERVSPLGTRSDQADLGYLKNSKAQINLRLRDDDDSNAESSTIVYSEPLPSPAPLLPAIPSFTLHRNPGCFMYYHTIATTSSSETIIARETLSPQTGRVLCLKVFRKKYITTNDLIAYPIRELLAYKRLAYAPKACGDAFVMRLEGCMQDKGRIFLAMQLMQCDLSNVLRGDAPHRPMQARRWIAQIAMGLAAIHAAGIIHRDIKPANILIDTQDNIKIADFGSSYIDDAGRPLDPLAKYSHHVAGTRGYMAPEMTLNQGGSSKYGLQVDYWSVGCVAYQLHLHTTKSPFATHDDLLRYIHWESNCFGRSYFSCVGLDEEAETLISGLLHPNPARRYGISDLVNHPYFIDSAGGSYFDNIEEQALRRPVIPWHHDLDEYYHEALVPPELFQPQWECPEQSKMNSMFEHFGWAHPHGFWSHFDSTIHDC